MIDRAHALPLTRQAELLKLSRSGLYYRPHSVSPADLAMMRRIDELNLDYPFASSRMRRELLRGEGIAMGRSRVATMMKPMGITVLFSPAEPVQTRARAQDPSVSAAWAQDQPAEPGAGD